MIEHHIRRPSHGNYLMRKLSNVLHHDLKRQSKASLQGIIVKPNVDCYTHLELRVATKEKYSDKRKAGASGHNT